MRPKCAKEFSLACHSNDALPRRFKRSTISNVQLKNQPSGPEQPNKLCRKDAAKERAKASSKVSFSATLLRVNSGELLPGAHSKALESI